MLAAARKYRRVVQVGMQRRSTPHFIEARDRYVRSGRLGRIRLAETYCYYHMRTRRNPPAITPPDALDYEMWAGPAPKIPFNEIIHPRGWRNFMEYSNGIIGDMCVHMLDMVALDARPRVAETHHIRRRDPGGYRQHRHHAGHPERPPSNTTNCRSCGSTGPGGMPPIRNIPGGPPCTANTARSSLSVHSYDFIPRGDEEPERGEALYEYDRYPEDRTEQDLERHVASAIRGHHGRLSGCDRTTVPTGSGH